MATMLPLSSVADPKTTAVPQLRQRLEAFAHGVNRHELRLDTSEVPLPDEFYYTKHRRNRNGNENHFQGIALSHDGRFLAVSGSNWKEPGSDILLFRLGAADRLPHPTVGFARLLLDPLLWHAGGIDACGNLLAVAVEYPHYTRRDPKRFSGRICPPSHGTSDRSSIRLIELGPEPRVLPLDARRDRLLATCAGFTRLLDGRFMLLTLAGAKVPEPAKNGHSSSTPLQIDCYLSDALNPCEITQSWSAAVPAGFPGCQSWSLLTDADTGEVVLTAFSGDAGGKLVPFVIRHPDLLPDDWESLDVIDVEVEPGDFRAGGTLVFTQGELRAFAVDRYRSSRNGVLSAVELTASTRLPVPIAGPGVPVLVTGTEANATPRQLVALRDTLDFRDLMYTPTLIEVPPKRLLEDYIREAKVDILDQGQTSECTGYALAAVIHRLLRSRELPNHRDESCVSVKMLYEMAKRYDEWPGVAYEGSSCRGAMKAWHRYGACLAEYWPERMAEIGWEDARKRPLGAYFRVNHRDLIAMHAALAEVGILYASAVVHSGWSLAENDGRIPYRDDKQGGHAFAIVAYDDEGFWIQNSWGESWGMSGFGRLSYDDWLENAMDVWVARLGAPVRVGQQSTAVGMEAASHGSRSYFFSDLRPHVISTGNQGAFRVNGTYGTNADDATQILTDDFKRVTANWSRRRLLLYAHGGLVKEDAALQRVADYLKPLIDSQIYPISFIWKTDFWTTVANIVTDALRQRRPEGPLDRMKDFLLDRLDDALEPIARAAGGLGIWKEMKENAELTTTSPTGAFRIVAPLLSQIRKTQDCELHFVAHSAGSIYFARLVQWLTARKRVFDTLGLDTELDSVTLWAPAISLRLFRETYMPAIESGIIRRFTLFTLNDRTEQADHCARVYNKSLLYLVSHALEDTPRGPHGRDGEPLLGLEKSLRAPDAADVRDLIARGRIEWILSPQQAPSAESRAEAHGAFDDDSATVRTTLNRILPAGTPVPNVEFARTQSSRQERRLMLDNLSA